jgi:hypothetical protein
MLAGVGIEDEGGLTGMAALALMTSTGEEAAVSGSRPVGATSTISNSSLN